MQLADFFDYKNQFMNDMLTNEAIIHLLTDDKALWEEPGKMMYTQVFPFEYVPDTMEHGLTFICCDVDVQRSLDKTYLAPVIYVWLFTHKSKLRLPDGGGVRTDKLASEIAKAINGSRMYGLGELEFYSAKRFAPINDYQGKVLTFHTKEFNRLSPTGKPVPSNRKSG